MISDDITLFPNVKYEQIIISPDLHLPTVLIYIAVTL